MAGVFVRPVSKTSARDRGSPAHPMSAAIEHLHHEPQHTKTFPLVCVQTAANGPEYSGVSQPAASPSRGCPASLIFVILPRALDPRLLQLPRPRRRLPGRAEALPIPAGAITGTPLSGTNAGEREKTPQVVTWALDSTGPPRNPDVRWVPLHILHRASRPGYKMEMRRGIDRSRVWMRCRP